MLRAASCGDVASIWHSASVCRRCLGIAATDDAETLAAADAESVVELISFIDDTDDDDDDRGIIDAQQASFPHIGN